MISLPIRWLVSVSLVIGSTAYGAEPIENSILQFADSLFCADPSASEWQFRGSQPTPARNPLKLVVWNVKKFEDRQSLLDLQTLLQQSDLVLLQEAMHDDDLQKLFVEKTDYLYTFFKSFCMDGRATGVNTATRWAVESYKRLISPDGEPIINTPKVTGYTLVRVQGKPVHVLNTHALNFNFGGDFRRQIDQVADFMRTLEGPIIWAGDFNTWSAKRLKYLHTITERLGLTHLQPMDDYRNLVLDHIFVRGLHPTQVRVRSERSSDHFPLEAEFEL